MTRLNKPPSRFEPVFIEQFPEQLQAGRLYVSISYNTTAHLCACGCGNEVIAPLSPAQWKLTYDGRDITLFPSIGSWNIPCQSHYWISNGEVRWAGSLTPGRIAAARSRDIEGVQKLAVAAQLMSPHPWWVRLSRRATGRSRR